MQKLNKALLNNHRFPADLDVTNPGDLPEKVIQFGEGNFLRAFVDWMFHRLNKKKLFNGRVVVVQPIAQGMVAKLNEQDGLYTLLLRGLQDGKVTEQKEIVTSVSRGLNPYTEWDEVLKCAENPAIEFVVSNTTESGIVYDKNDRLDAKPPSSYPGKLTTYLYHRYQHFNGDAAKGMVIVPCELIDRNGDNLKRIVLQLAGEWQLPAAFSTWVKEHNYFLNTLVDRVVTGFPKDEVEKLTKYLGYQDDLLDTGELFHLWVIEGPQHLSERLPFTKIGLDVIWTDDMSPYRTRKVRILNGAHTASIPVAFLYGLETVGEMMDHLVMGQFTRQVIYEELMPSIDLDKEMLQEFAAAVIERFQNPYIKHYLLSILLNSSSKFKTRDLPSLIGYQQLQGKLPEKLTFSLAALLSVYRDGVVEGPAMKAMRPKGPFTMQDDMAALVFFSEAWQAYAKTEESTVAMAAKMLANEEIWGQDLNSIPGLTEKVGYYLHQIATVGIQPTVAKLVK
ncbi:MAG: tagaturonate reductase [Negativicutes bacterium]|nr:tagaturonate reductase [Negativicutes bacterium]